MAKELKEAIITRSTHPEFYQQVVDILFYPGCEHIMPIHLIYMVENGELDGLFSFGSGNVHPIPNPDFKTRLIKRRKKTVDEISFLLATYSAKQFYSVPFTPWNYRIKPLNLPEWVLKLIEPTKGYLIFIEQGAEFFSKVFNCSYEEGILLAKRLNKKWPSAFEKIDQMEIDGKPVDWFVELFINPKMGPVFITKPIRQANLLLEYLAQEDKLDPKKRITWKPK